MPSFTIHHRPIGPQHPPYILAEVACAHEGDPDLVQVMIKAAADAGADGIQFQLFSADGLVSPSSEKYAIFDRLQIAYTEWIRLIQEAKAVKLDVWANVFDCNAMTVAVNAGADVLKLHSTDVSNPLMLEAAATAGLPLSVATGGTTLDELTTAVTTLRQHGLQDLLLMHGFQAFPTQIEDAHLRWIRTLHTLFNVPVGYMDHTAGDDPLALTLPLVAMAEGACVLEKHITHNRELKGTDYYSSLGPEAFAQFVKQVHNVATARGTGTAQLMSNAEQTYRQTMKKTIVCRVDKTTGDSLAADDLIFVRNDVIGFTPAQAHQVIGHTLTAPIPAYSTILPTHLGSQSSVVSSTVAQ